MRGIDDIEQVLNVQVPNWKSAGRWPPDNLGSRVHLDPGLSKKQPEAGAQAPAEQPSAKLLGDEALRQVSELASQTRSKKDTF
mmetsp:Transcript_45278/g.73741  ORF Transcript_45278/g.73741 Transcript_45278/m.73741 type:complete len:83 (+) Transcript_45278:1455-1703(+)